MLRSRWSHALRPAAWARGDGEPLRAAPSALNTIGGSAGRDIATGAGLIGGGAILGNQIEGSGAARRRTVQQCSMQNVMENRHRLQRDLGLRRPPLHHQMATTPAPGCVCRWLPVEERVGTMPATPAPCAGAHYHRRRAESGGLPHQPRAAACPLCLEMPTPRVGTALDHMRLC